MLVASQPVICRSGQWSCGGFVFFMIACAARSAARDIRGTIYTCMSVWRLVALCWRWLLNAKNGVGLLVGLRPDFLDFSFLLIGKL